MNTYKYVSHNGQNVCIQVFDENGAFVCAIPMDNSNTDYINAMAAVNAGKITIEAAQEAALVPQSVTPRQVRLLLLQQGLLANVEAIIAQQGEATKITWQYASTFNRDDPLLNQLAVTLGLSEQQVDQFFVAAAAL